MGIIDKIGLGNSNCTQTMFTYNNFDFYDLDDDGIYEWLSFAMPGPWTIGSIESQNCMKASIIIYKMIDLFDDDNDGVPNHLDKCPETPDGVLVDTNGCEIFSMPENNYKVDGSD